MTSLRAVSECVLLSAFGILSAAVPIWLDLLAGKAAKAPSRPTHDSRSTAGQDGWGVSDSEAEDQNLQIVELREAALSAVRDNNWVAWHERQRGDARRFASSQLGPTLTVARITLRPQTALLGRFEAMSGVRWEEKQLQALC